MKRTEISSSFKIDVVNAGSNSDDQAQSLELLQIILVQSNWVPHESRNGFIQNLKQTSNR